MRIIFFLKLLAFIIFIVMPIYLFFYYRKKKKATLASNLFEDEFQKGNYEACLKLLHVQFFSWSSDDDERKANLGVISKMSNCLAKLNVEHEKLTTPAMSFLNKYMSVDTNSLNEKEKEEYDLLDAESIKPIVRFLSAINKNKSVSQAMLDANKKGFLD
jgi:hypothetical protein